jgi:hypothetical protein
MHFKIIGPVTGIATIATGTRIREWRRLRKTYGPGRWRKRKGFARIRLSDCTICQAEIHWYEAHGIGANEHKIKRILDSEL